MGRALSFSLLDYSWNFLWGRLMQYKSILSSADKRGVVQRARDNELQASLWPLQSEMRKALQLRARIKSHSLLTVQEVIIPQLSSAYGIIKPFRDHSVPLDSIRCEWIRSVEILTQVLRSITTARPLSRQSYHVTWRPDRQPLMQQWESRHPWFMKAKRGYKHNHSFISVG